MQVGTNLSEARKHWLKQVHELDEIQHDGLHHTSIVHNKMKNGLKNLSKIKRFKKEIGPFGMIPESYF